MCHHGLVVTSNSQRLFRILASSTGLMAVSVLAAACSAGEGTPLPNASDITISELASPTDPVATAPPTSTADKDVPEEGLPQTEVVNLFIDADEGGVQEVSVPLGSPVNIRIRSSSGDEFHLHGYELVLEGIDVTFSFTADRLGNFVLEGHDSGGQLLILTVFED